MSERKQLLAELEAISRRSYCGSPPPPDVATELLKSAQGDVQLTALASVILGHAWQHFSEHNKAQMAFSTAIEGFKAAKRPKDETEAIILLGMSYLQSGEPLRALDCWSNALLLARKINDRELCTRVYLGVSQVYIGFGDYQSSLNFNELALEMARRLKHDERKGEALLNVASDAFRLGRYNYTLQCVAEAEKILNTSVTNKIWSAEVVYFRGRVHAEQGYLQQAKLELETAYQLSEQNDNLWGKAHACVALGEVLLKLQDPTASEVLEAGYAMASEAKLAALLERSSLALITWYEQQGNLAATLVHYNTVLQDEQTPHCHIAPAHLKRIQQLMTASQLRVLERDLANAH